MTTLQDSIDKLADMAVRATEESRDARQSLNHLRWRVHGLYEAARDVAELLDDVIDKPEFAKLAKLRKAHRELCKAVDGMGGGK